MEVSIQAAKSKEAGSSLKLSEETQPANTLILDSDLPGCKIINLSQVSRFVIICYGSYRNLIH